MTVFFAWCPSRIPLFTKLPLTREFSRPLARVARVCTTQNLAGSERRVLVIVTTMALDPARRRYKKTLVEELSEAATEHTWHGHLLPAPSSS
jgi:hypothetical protein